MEVRGYLLETGQFDAEYYNNYSIKLSLIASACEAGHVRASPARSCSRADSFIKQNSRPVTETWASP